MSLNTTGEWSIDEMMLYAEGPLSVTNGAANALIYDARLELAGSAPGTYTTVRGQTYYEVAAGDANFIAIGNADDEWATLPVSNATAITAIESGGEWRIGAFSVEYVDGSSDTWTMTVGNAVWLDN